MTEMKQVLVIGIGMLAALAACGGDELPPPASCAAEATFAAAASGTVPAETPIASAVVPTELRAAIASHLCVEGLSGRLFGLTDPVDCSALPFQFVFPEDEACIFGPTSLGTERANVLVSLARGVLWDITLEQLGGAWAVTDTSRVDE
jgi:hypothetical protein